MLGRDPTVDALIRFDGVEQTRAWRIGLLCACGAILAALIIIQQHGRALHEQTFAEPTAGQRARERAYDPGVAPLTVESKVLVMAAEAGAVDAEDLDELLAALEPMAITRAERLRLAIVLADIGRREEALRRLDVLRAEADPGGGIQIDAEWLSALYRDGTEAVPLDAQHALTARHGWFGRLALAHGLSRSDPARRQLVMRLWRIGRFGTGLAIGFGLATLLGIGALALIIVHLRRAGFDWSGPFERGAISTYDHLAGRMVGPAGGGDAVMLETVALFLVGLLLAVGAPIMAYAGGVEGASATLILTQILMWAVLGVVAWPLMRGVSWGRLVEDLGLTRGVGIGREAAFGVIGYAASLPMLAVAMQVGQSLEAILGGGGTGEGADGYPLMEQPLANSWVAVLFGAAGAVIWAPIIEEIVYRGALYRFLRARLSAAVTILLTASVFAIGHPYAPLGILSVFVSGVAFGLLREWRGSLVAPMVAHALHNTIAVAPTIVYLRLLEM